MDAPQTRECQKQGISGQVYQRQAAGTERVCIVPARHRTPLSVTQNHA